MVTAMGTQIDVVLTGVTALMMHNNRLSDPLDILVKEIKTYSGKRKKTEDDQEMMSKLEFEGGLYFDKETGPYVPARAVEAALITAARVTKRGKDAVRGLRVMQEKMPLQYEGPRTIGGLWADRSFVDRRSVVIQQSRLMRTRPIFNPPWSLEVSIAFLPDVLNPQEVIDFVKLAGTHAGLLEWRPRYGAFTVKVVK